MSLYDSEGTEAYAILGPGDDLGECVRGRGAAIWLNLSGLLFDCRSVTSYGALFAATDHPAVRLLRINVQGFAEPDTGEVKQIYAARTVTADNVVVPMRLAGFAIADKALSNLRTARKDQHLNFFGSCARAREVVKSWMEGGADPRALREFHEVCQQEVRGLMWDERGNSNNPISHAIGAVSRLASDCLELDACKMLSTIVRRMTSVVAVKYDVEVLVGYRRGGELMRDRSGEMALDWDIEPILREYLLPTTTTP